MLGMEMQLVLWDQMARLHEADCVGVGRECSGHINRLWIAGAMHRSVIATGLWECSYSASLHEDESYITMLKRRRDLQQ